MASTVLNIAMDGIAPVSVEITGHFYSIINHGKAMAKGDKDKILCRAQRVKDNIVQTAQDLYLGMDKDMNISPNFDWITVGAANKYSGKPITTAKITPVSLY